MLIRFGGRRSGASFGCGAFLVLLGLVFLSPVIDWLVAVLGYIFIALGIIVLVLAVVSWLFGPRRRDY